MVFNQYQNTTGIYIGILWYQCWYDNTIMDNNIGRKQYSDICIRLHQNAGIVICITSSILVLVQHHNFRTTKPFRELRKLYPWSLFHNCACSTLQNLLTFAFFLFHYPTPLKNKNNMPVFATWPYSLVTIKPLKPCIFIYNYNFAFERA